MKRTILISMMLLFAAVLNAQRIQYSQNDMTDEHLYQFVSRAGKTLLTATDDGESGLIFMPSFDEDLDKSLSRNVTLTCIVCFPVIEGLLCVEEGTMIIRFTNGERITLNSYNKHNCEPRYFFAVTPMDRVKLHSLVIDKIMVEDGRTYKSYTSRPDNPSFFIEMKEAASKPFVKKSNQ